MVKKQSISKAVTIGKSLAAATLKRRTEALQKRERALAKMTMKAAPAAKALSRQLAAAPASAGVLIARGRFVVSTTLLATYLKELEDLHGYDVESVAHRGDTVEDMAYSEGQLDVFSRRLEKVLRSGPPPRAILLSGGGNDIAGDEFAILLNHAMSNISRIERIRSLLV